MKLATTAAVTVVVLAIAGGTMLAMASGKGSLCSKEAGACDPSACKSEAKTVAVTKPHGKVLGHFDLATAGCRFACATQSKYDPKAVVAQPGAKEGKLTQCPVSGVVFSVDKKRPHVRVGTDDYITCCDTCAEKLRKNPHRFVRA